MSREELYKMAQDILEMDENLDIDKYNYGLDQVTINQVIMRLNYLRTLYRMIDKNNKNNDYIINRLIQRTARLLPGFLIMKGSDEDGKFN